MKPSNSYCYMASSGKLSQLHKAYHDTEYGFKAQNDNEIFGQLILEINQAGLSWDTIINKKESIRKAYANFDIDSIASFTEKSIETLLQNPGVIRMAAKIKAIIYNAQQVKKLQLEHGSFINWLDKQHPLEADDWIKLFKKTFKFTGKEITKEFLMSNGYLKGAHEENCPIYKKYIEAQPMWYAAKK